MYLLVLQNYTQIAFAMVLAYVAFPEHLSNYFPCREYVFNSYFMELNPSTVPSISIKMTKFTWVNLWTQSDCLINQLQERCYVRTCRWVWLPESGQRTPSFYWATQRWNSSRNWEAKVRENLSMLKTEIKWHTNELTGARAGRATALSAALQGEDAD